jgi:spoIIIJ-associated protein
MLNNDDFEKIKEETQKFFDKMSFEVEIEFLPQEGQTISINIIASEPQILIGEGGQTLAEIQHLLKIILKRKITTELFFIDLDISDYKKKKNEYLRELAKDAANEVSLCGKEKILPPMSAYERRIIHLELAGRSDVKTDSLGEGSDRKIIIKPII